MSDWENSDSEPSAPVKAPAPIKPPVKSKWEGEDEEDGGGGAAWDASSDEDSKAKKPIGAAVATAPRKKGTLKAKLAQKEAERAAREAAGEEYATEDEFLDEEAVRRQRKEAELAADLSNAQDLLGGSAGGASQASQLNALLTFSPKSKDDFVHLSEQLLALVLRQHQSKPLYPVFVELFARELAGPLRDVETRKVASTLTALANEKQKEQRDKAAGKGKKKAASKPALGIGKVAGKLDTSTYEEVLDDFGTKDDDFM